MLGVEDPEFTKAGSLPSQRSRLVDFPYVFSLLPSPDPVLHLSSEALKAKPV